MSLTIAAIALTLTAAFVYAGIVLYGAWIDGKRQAIRNKGLHPVTMPGGRVEAMEQEDGRINSEHNDEHNGEHEDGHENHQG